MKILELTRAFYPSVGGMEKYVADRLKIYEALGIRYNLIGTDFNSGKTDYTLSRNDAIFLRQFSRFNVTFGLKKILKQDFDILSVNLIGRHFSDYAILLASRKRKKIILTPHFTFHTEKYSFIKKIYTRFIFPILLERVSRIICFTQFEANYWENNFKNIIGKTLVIPHYINIEGVNFNNKKNIDNKFILYIGRGEKNKRIDLLIEAFTKIKDKNWKLLLTIKTDELDKKVSDYAETDKRIELLGYITEEKKQELLNSCSALVLPTSFEAFGTVILEASAVSKPIICSNLPVLREILSEEGTIFFENNVDNIKTAMDNLINLSEEDRRKMGSANFKNAKKYSFDKALINYRKLFEEFNFNQKN